VFKTNDIFCDIPIGLTELFNYLPWEILNNLKNFISQNIKPSFNANVKINYFSPLMRHILIMPDGEIRLEGFEVSREHFDGEKPHILINGQIIKDATLICAGAILTDTLIQIGSGCIVEPGALIKGPAIIGDPGPFPFNYATLMVGPNRNGEATTPVVPGALCTGVHNPYSLAVNGDAAIFDNLDVSENIPFPAVSSCIGRRTPVSADITYRGSEDCVLDTA